jgi:4-cresol dehydrogenase (hydroxylating)
MSTKNIALAIEEFQKIFGMEGVVTSQIECEQFEQTTFYTTQKIKGILYPKSENEIQECIKVANKYKVKFYPLSTGMNIGLGGTVPVESDCFILILKKMNKIIEFNEDFAYITIEPGVTQKQVVEFLESKGSNLMLSSTGSLPETSIVGNVLERGDTRGPITQRAENVCRFGVVLPDASYLETGFGRFKNAKTSNLSKYGVGPDYTGIFMQSNLGVITQLTLWLSPKSPASETILFTIETEVQLKKTINTLLKLKLQNIITYVDIFNEYKSLTSTQQYPWELFKDKKKFQEFVRSWKDKRGAGCWNGIIVIRSLSTKCTKIIRKAIIKEIRPSIKNIISTSELKFKLIKKLRKPLEYILGLNLKFLIETPNISIFQGVPYSDAFRSLYWRKKSPVPTEYHPEKDKCGALWVAIALPFFGEDVVSCVSLAKKILENHEFEPNISLLGISERIMTMTICIIYDREVQGEDERAMECHDKIINSFCSLGYYPSRLGIQTMKKLPKTDDDFDFFAQKIKTAIDPNDIIAPGRYDFRHNWQK